MSGLARMVFAMGYPLALVSFSVSVWCVCFLAALAVVAAIAQRLEWTVPEIAAQSHRRDVVHDCGCTLALKA